MKYIKIYDTDEAEHDVNADLKTGIRASIKKWTTITRGLWRIYEEMLENCGLCFEHSDCDQCPLVKCGWTGSEYYHATRTARIAWAKSHKFLLELKSLEREEN